MHCDISLIMINVNAKCKNKSKIILLRLGIKLRTMDPKSVMLTPRPSIQEKCLEKSKIYRPGFLKIRFHTSFDNELLSKLQQFKNFPKLILITFSAKRPFHIEMVIKNIIGCMVITHP